MDIANTVDIDNVLDEIDLDISREIDDIKQNTQKQYQASRFQRPTDDGGGNVHVPTAPTQSPKYFTFLKDGKATKRKANVP